jgi:7-keto-8-aminopelargonate synthetase-like enzyme
MTISFIEHLVACQADLIAALDTRDAGMIERASQVLGKAIDATRGQDSWLDTQETGKAIKYALKQSEAARIRVNYMAGVTRQRIDRLAELRGATITKVYTNNCNII